MTGSPAGAFILASANRSPLNPEPVVDCMQLALASQMRELDRQTIEEIGIPGMVLMENAGRGTVDLMLQTFGSLTEKTVCIFVGPGNNGGDGLVIARTVHGLGALPYLFYLVDPDQLQGDAARNHAIAKKLNLPSQILDHRDRMATLMSTILTLDRIHPVHSLVDAIFGIGLTREIDGQFLEAVNCINFLRDHHGMPVVAVDIPSGLDSNTGKVLGAVVNADLTVTYGLAKPGHYHHGGPHTGRLERVDIGIPVRLAAAAGLRGSILDTGTASLLARRLTTAHKGTTGHLLILAGSEGKTGAALLCGQGALRSGAGLVTFAVPHDLHPIFEIALAESMSVSLPASRRHLSVDDHDLVVSITAGKNALVLGPGIGTEPATVDLVLRLYTGVSQPMVVDADALNILAAHPELIPAAGGPRILTPHPGEMARLLDTTTQEVQEDRLAAAMRLLAPSGQDQPPLVIVLKGAGTLVASTRGDWVINTSGNPGMATGGMGDVLAGVIGSFLAQGYPPWDAARLGVYLHGLAADLLARSSPYGFTAAEVAGMLPQTVGTRSSQTSKEKIC